MGSDIILNLLALGSVVGAILLGGSWLRRLVRGAGNGETPGCMACGMAAEKLETFVCPGCGIDVRRVGVGTRGRRNSPLVKVAGFTLLLIVLAAVAGGILSSVLPQEQWSTQEANLHTADLNPSSTKPWLVHIEVTGRHAAGKSLRGRVIMEIVSEDGMIGGMEFHAPEMVGRMYGERGLVEERTFDRDAIIGCMKEAGVLGEMQTARTTADLLYKKLNDALEGRSPGVSAGEHFSGGSGWSSWSVPPRWVLPGMAMVSAGIWLAWVGRMVRKAELARRGGGA